MTTQKIKFFEGIPVAVLASFNNPKRISPMLAGSALIEGDSLTVRTATQTIKVQAPKRLLKQVFEWCDGTRTLDVLALHYGKASTQSKKNAPKLLEEFLSFVDFLLTEGALIDANFAVIEASKLGHQTSPVGTVADKTLTNTIARRFLDNPSGSKTKSQHASAKTQTINLPKTGLGELFAKRLSTRTFNDRSISTTQLHELLWATAGVVDTQHPRDPAIPRRTLGSGGAMHLLRVYVVLKRTVGNYAAGAYRVHYPRAQSVSLEPITTAHDLLWRAFITPADLSFATGAIFLIAQPHIGAIRYRTRAMQYLWMEAGAALQNASLTAAHLDVGHAIIGGYTEDVVLKLLQQNDLQSATANDLPDMVFGASIFGAMPTDKQVQLAGSTAKMKFQWVNEASDIYPMQSHLARTQLVVNGEERPLTWGRGASAWLAMRKAEAEAIEREGFYAPQNIVQGAMHEHNQGAWGTLIHPERFCKYSPAQYQRKGFRYQPFNPLHTYAWAQGVNLLTQAPALVLAELVFATKALKGLGCPVDHPFGLMTSSGCAAGLTKEDAIYRGLLEVIERDAFMRHWLAQKGGQIVNPQTYPAPIQQAIEAVERTGAMTLVQRLTSPWAEVALVSVKHPTKHFTTMATSAALSFERAVLGALDEIETRVFDFIHGPSIEVPEPRQVVGVEDHYRLYADKSHFNKADSVLFPNNKPLSKARSAALFQPSEPAQSEQLAILLARFKTQGIAPVSVTMTPQHNTVDQGRTKLEVVKVLVPDCVPLYFGYGYEPLGMIGEYDSAAFFPHPFP
jgi:ribosomal protein S12 methylthiotransferase accessory factor